MILEKRFVSHFMLIEAIANEKQYCIWSAEEMRSNKACRVIEYFDIDNNPYGDQRLRIASEIKNRSLPFVVKIIEVFKEENSGFIVSEIPASGVFEPEKIFDSQKFFAFGDALLKVFILMQRNGIGIEDIGYEDIFLDNGGAIQLMFSERLMLKPEKEDRSNEIRVFAGFLLRYALSDMETPVPLTNEFLTENFPEKIAAFFDETLLQGKIERLDALSHYFQWTREVKTDPVIIQSGTDTLAFNRALRYGLPVAAFLLFLIVIVLSDSTSDQNPVVMKNIQRVPEQKSSVIPAEKTDLQEVPKTKESLNVDSSPKVQLVKKVETKGEGQEKIELSKGTKREEPQSENFLPEGIYIDSENVPVGGSGGLEITNNQTVAQSFTMKHAGKLIAVDLIDLKLHRCTPSASLYVSLVNIHNGKLGEYSYYTRELHPNEISSTTRLNFGHYGPTVYPGDQYAVYLQTNASGCTYSWGGEYKTYDGGETFINQIPNFRDMKFRSYIRMD